MVGTSTPRLQLYKPDDGDNVNVDTDLNANMDKVDLLGKNPVGVVGLIRRNTADAVTSATNSMFETLTVNLKAGRWYRVLWAFRYNNSASAPPPSSTVQVHLKAGGTVAVGDPIICTGNVTTQNATNPRMTLDTLFDVPTDGSYTLGCSGNSGTGALTLNILASGGTDNTGVSRILYVQDGGEKP